MMPSLLSLLNHLLDHAIISKETFLDVVFSFPRISVSCFYHLLLGIFSFLLFYITFFFFSFFDTTPKVQPVFSIFSARFPTRQIDRTLYSLGTSQSLFSYCMLMLSQKKSSKNRLAFQHRIGPTGQTIRGRPKAHWTRQ